MEDTKENRQVLLGTSASLMIIYIIAKKSGSMFLNGFVFGALYFLAICVFIYYVKIYGKYDIKINKKENKK